MVYLAAFLAIAWIVAIAWHIDDWRRDPFCNWAETTPDAKDPRLRPLVVPADPSSVLLLVQHAAEHLPGWRLVDTAIDSDWTAVRLERQTRLFRFTDDVTVRLRRVEDGTEVSARSKSRIGKSDLGQNPRNIHELFEAIRALTSAAASGERQP